MNKYLAIALILLASGTAPAQTAAGDASQIGQIQDVVGALISKPVKAVILLTDLTEVSGYVIALEYDTFNLSTDKKGYTSIQIAYADVLAISSKRGSVSFIPDPRSTPHGTWTDLKKLRPNVMVEITLKNGEIQSGRFRSSTPDTLVMSDKQIKKEWTLQRAEIAFVHRVRYGVRDVGGSVAGGTGKGAKVGKGVGSVLGGVRGPISGQPMGDGSGGLFPLIGAGIGALAGAAKGAVDKSGSIRVLVFSQ